ncbi:phosphoenolpyruvate-protein phosphotransferase [Ameyamaea chiangmaiensis NBRC 103196]|uniref:Phosphoenolpyruvate-protein phosphotransferase n=1 Tax=Ameyamaea chiangmaiensis TaxID=442969 RepID=A0A850PCB6_9PROT|nr:phosphoenolpyruvate--protein phosphotransferase [Ameyamaea chiangmaiensis]MBS4075312.1 phosphoenolpyruvate--protein phosphotransferase [Ameyamaea chiangmaiensis]NVN41598.1 phosphoenolpyruvate--protein phosphotransferase [Ameyamaea chiangmaiensis]GBQ66725.1 phosphoenolpyruvate-protein phosphotransferase [Ameyamaea chiangmaiensis NBRC 103196]
MTDPSAAPPRRRRPVKAAPAPSRPPPRQFQGEPVYPGIAIGVAIRTGDRQIPTDLPRASVHGDTYERARLDEAVDRARRQIGKLRDRLALLPEEGQVEIGSLLEVYHRMLGPSRLLRGIEARISRDALTAEAAVMDEVDALCTAMLAPMGNKPEEDERAAQARRAGELREIGRRLVRNLTGASFRTFAGAPDGAVLVAEQLRPSDAALIDPSRVTAVVTEEGGSTDHTSIMLRALGIPSVLAAHGVTEALARAGEGTEVIVNGATGVVVVAPDAPMLAEARDGVAAYARERQALNRLRRLASRLSGGEKIRLQANFEIPAELPLIAQSGASGIGLLRSEFLFINASVLPDEDEQAEAYAAVITAMGGDETTIRVVDWGGEKQSEALSRAGITMGEDGLNPALGVRGIRLLLQNPGFLETQFAAILRASLLGPVRVLLPMVTLAEEIAQARALYEHVARRLRRRGVKLGHDLPPLGIMVETPAAALMAESLAVLADFMAIGTNDLTMYTLAVDRASADVATLYDPLHPAVLRLIEHTTAAGVRHNRPVSLCGEIAGDPVAVPLLIGMGLRSFSMSASAVPRVKRAIRGTTLDACRDLRARVLHETDPTAVRLVLTAGSGT